MKEDLVKVVRCKDCIHWLKMDGKCFPNADFNDFCSNGETLDHASSIVRCKDCKHSQKDELFGNIYWCKGVAVRDDHFCSNGERKDDEID